jgi:hypothetical protein
MSDHTPAYLKSTYSGTADDCVEVARNLRSIHVRDSKDVALPSITASRPSWAAFLSALRESYL